MIYHRLAGPAFAFGMLCPAVVAGLILGGFIHVRRIEALQAPPSLRDNARATVFALIALRRADGACIELRTLSMAVGLSEGELALQLAGNPSIAWRQGAVDYVRWYRYTAPTENAP